MTAASPSRSTKQKAGSPSYNDSRTKREILQFAAQFFCFRVNDVAFLVRGRIPNHNDKRSIRNTLTLLYREGLLERLPYLDIDREYGGVSHVYGLTTQGAKEVARYYDGKVKIFDHHSQRTLDHELEITMFHIALKRMCAKHGLTLYWRQHDLKRTINPDALFTITDPAKPEGQNTFRYFLEIERAKSGHYVEGESSIMAKLGKFYDFYNTDECRKQWGFGTYRVVIVQPTSDRRYNLLAALNKQYNHRMFWLTTEPLYKEGIGGAIFKTPKDHIERSYSFIESQ